MTTDIFGRTVQKRIRTSSLSHKQRQQLASGFLSAYNSSAGQSARNFMRAAPVMARRAMKQRQRDTRAAERAERAAAQEASLRVG